MTEGLPGILERYHAASLAARDAEFFVRCRERKGYLTRELAEAWRIGCAPTLAQCAQAWAAAGFDRATCERELRSAGLLIDPVADGPDRSAYMFFRDCMIFAWHGPATKDGPGSLLYFSSRRLKDLEIDGTPLPKDKKALCMRSPGQDGKGGLARPPGFNLPALARADLQELAVVEGALDAIACTAMGHVAVAQIGAAIREDLGKLLRAWLAADPARTLYFIPDASPDMKPLRRLQGCRHAGPHIRIALLPVNRDPDEVTAEELAAAKAAAEPAWRVTVDTMVGLVELEGQGADALATAGARPGEHKDLWQQLCAWAKADRALGERIWAAYQRLMRGGLDQALTAELRGQLGLPACGDVDPVGVVRALGTGEKLVPGQIDPFKPARDAEGHLPKFYNWHYETRMVRNRKGDLEEKQCRIADDLVTVRASMSAVFGGWPARIHAPGAKAPMLFVHYAGARCVQWMQSGIELEAFLKRHTQLFFEGGKDVDGKNFTTPANLYSDLGGSAETHEFKAVEYFPHAPALDGHYYLWRYPDEHKDDGGALFEFLSYFDNTSDDTSLTTVLAGILTVFWGGDYSQRPIIVNEASHRGSGKSSVAKKTARLVGGYIAMTLGNSRDETEMMQRLLSPRGREKRVCLWDNVDSSREVKSPWLDQNVTHDEISGKQMFLGEGTRPNNLCWWITVNNARLSPDIARRSFAARFHKPKYRPDWEPNINEVVDRRGDEIAADCMAILRAPLAGDVGWVVVEESFSNWASEVFARAHAWLLERGLITETLEQCMQANAAWRHSRDDDVMEAAFIMQELVARVAKERGYVNEAGQVEDMKLIYGRNHDDANDEFIPTLRQEGDVHRSMCDHLEAILNRREVNAKWTGNVLSEHIKSGRMDGLEGPLVRRQRRGWLLRGLRIREYLNALESTEKDASQPPPQAAD